MTGGYVSPYGKPRGLASRLADWGRRMGTDTSLPWAGLGIMEDLKLAATILNKREWLEALRLSDDPDAQRFANELLDDTDTLDATQAAANSVETPIAANTPESAYHVATYDPLATIEQLDAEAVKGQRAMREIREIRELLEAQDVVDDATPTDDLPGILRALLS